MFKNNNEFYDAIDLAITNLRKNNFSEEAQVLYIAKNNHTLPGELFGEIKFALQSIEPKVTGNPVLHKEVYFLLSELTRVFP